MLHKLRSRGSEYLWREYEMSITLMLIINAHLKVGTEADDALQVCAVVTQNVLPTQQRDLITIHV